MAQTFAREPAWLCCGQLCATIARMTKTAFRAFSIVALSVLLAACAFGSPTPQSQDPLPPTRMALTPTQSPTLTLHPTQTLTATARPTAAPTASPRPTATARVTPTLTIALAPTATARVAPTLTVALAPSATARVPLTLTVAQAPGDTVSPASTAVSPSHLLLPTPAVTPTGTAPSTLAPSALPAPGVGPGGDRRFGAIEAFDNPGAAAQLGVGWTRVRFQWNVIQPDDAGQWNDAELDKIVTAESAAGREVLGLVVNTPPWALKDGAVAGVPAGMELPADDPNNVWASFIRRLATQYAGRVNRWIIWNEPDIWDSSYPGQTWGGLVGDFVQFQRIAYTVIKAANPEAVVHLSGFTYWWDAQAGRTPFFRRFLEELTADPNAAGNKYYFDVASVHLYFRTDTVYNLTAWHHETMRTFGFDKPVWLVETNAAPAFDPAWPVADPAFRITLEEQAAFVIQVFAMGLAGGAERIAVYKLADTPGDKAANPEPFGLVRMDGSRRPAFAAFQLASRYLSGYRSAALDRRDEVAQVTVERGAQVTTVLWSRVGPAQRVTLTARAAKALVVDSRTGASRTESAVGGQYVLDLPGATCTQPVEDGCLIGGWPLLVVEQVQ